MYEEPRRAEQWQSIQQTEFGCQSPNQLPAGGDKNAFSPRRTHHHHYRRRNSHLPLLTATSIGPTPFQPVALTIHHVGYKRTREEDRSSGSSRFPGESPSSQLTETGLTGEPNRPTRTKRQNRLRIPPVAVEVTIAPARAPQVPW